MCERSTTILGLLNSLAIADQLNHVLDSAVRVLREHGEMLDSAGSDAAPSSRLFYERPAGGSQADEPRVLREAAHVLVLWKPAGWTVSVDSFSFEPKSKILDNSRGMEKGNTSHNPNCQIQDWIMLHFGSAMPISRDKGVGHGIVHRLDQDTSGLLLCSKSYRGFFTAQAMMAARRVHKEYVCLCHGHYTFTDIPHFISARLRTVSCSTGIKRSEIAEGVGGRQAITEVQEVCHLTLNSTKFSLVKVCLHTGRRHQIRAHFNLKGNPLVGDTRYGIGAEQTKVPWCPRLFLHARRLKVDVDEVLDVVAALPDDLASALQHLDVLDHRSRACLRKFPLKAHPAS